MGNVCKSRMSSVVVTDKFDKDLNEIIVEEDDDVKEQETTPKPEQG